MKRNELPLDPADILRRRMGYMVLLRVLEICGTRAGMRRAKHAINTFVAIAHGHGNSRRRPKREKRS